MWSGGALAPGFLPPTGEGSASHSSIIARRSPHQQTQASSVRIGPHPPGPPNGPSQTWACWRVFPAGASRNPPPDALGSFEPRVHCGLDHLPWHLFSGLFPLSFLLSLSLCVLYQEPSSSSPSSFLFLFLSLNLQPSPLSCRQSLSHQ